MVADPSGVLMLTEEELAVAENKHVEEYPVAAECAPACGVGDVPVRQPPVHEARHRAVHLRALPRRPGLGLAGFQNPGTSIARRPLGFP